MKLKWGSSHTRLSSLAPWGGLKVGGVTVDGGAVGGGGGGGGWANG